MFGRFGRLMIQTCKNGTNKANVFLLHFFVCSRRSLTAPKNAKKKLVNGLATTNYKPQTT